MTQAQTTIDGLPIATVLALQDEMELDQFNSDTAKRQSRKATLQQIMALFAGQTSPVVSITAADSPYNAQINQPVILADATAGAIVINLPAIAAQSVQIRVKKVDSSANTVTLIPQAGNTIDGVASFVLSFPEESIEPLPFNSNWNNF